jgi:hypothetical protein
MPRIGQICNKRNLTVSIWRKRGQQGQDKAIAVHRTFLSLDIAQYPREQGVTQEEMNKWSFFTTLRTAGRLHMRRNNSQNPKRFHQELDGQLIKAQPAQTANDGPCADVGRASVRCNVCHREVNRSAAATHFHIIWPHRGYLPSNFSGSLTENLCVTHEPRGTTARLDGSREANRHDQGNSG